MSFQIVQIREEDLMFKKKINIYSLILIVLVLTMTIIFYDKLLKRFPYIGTLKGEVDNYVSKLLGAFLSLY